MSVPALRVLHGGSSNDEPPRPDPEPKAAESDPAPRWWRWIVIQSLRHGIWVPPLWPMLVALRMLRSWSIRRAMQAMKKELDWDGDDDFNFIAAFIRVEKERRQDPAFWAACEKALKIGRITIFGRLPVILDREIEGRGQGAFILHLAWSVTRKLPDPLPWGFAP